MRFQVTDVFESVCPGYFLNFIFFFSSFSIFDIRWRKEIDVSKWFSDEVIVGDSLKWI